MAVSARGTGGSVTAAFFHKAHPGTTTRISGDQHIPSLALKTQPDETAVKCA
jgi:hypothetical protein